MDEDNYFKYSSGKFEEEPQEIEDVQILDQLEEQEEIPRQTIRESRKAEESEEDSNMIPTYLVGESRNLSHGKKRHKSMGRVKPKVTIQQPNKTK